MGSLIVAKPEHSMTAWSKLIGMVDQIHSKVTVPLQQAARCPKIQLMIKHLIMLWVKQAITLIKPRKD